MINQNTLQGDVLDILFANRNKQYGAYLLRRTYPDRLKRSLGIMLAGVVLLSGWMTWKSHRPRYVITEYPGTPPPPVTPKALAKDPPKPPIQHPVVSPRGAPPRRCSRTSRRPCRRLGSRRPGWWTTQRNHYRTLVRSANSPSAW